jgi:hypothetical protein
VSCFRSIAVEKADYPIWLLCGMLGVSRAGSPTATVGPITPRSGDRAGGSRDDPVTADNG